MGLTYEEIQNTYPKVVKSAEERFRSIAYFGFLAQNKNRWFKAIVLANWHIVGDEIGMDKLRETIFVAKTQKSKSRIYEDSYIAHETLKELFRLTVGKEKPIELERYIAEFNGPKKSHNKKDYDKQARANATVELVAFVSNKFGFNPYHDKKSKTDKISGSYIVEKIIEKKLGYSKSVDDIWGQNNDLRPHLKNLK